MIVDLRSRNAVSASRPWNSHNHQYHLRVKSYGGRCCLTYTVNPVFVVVLARNERPTGADQVTGAAAPIWLAALPPYAV